MERKGMKAGKDRWNKERLGAKGRGGGGRKEEDEGEMEEGSRREKTEGGRRMKQGKNMKTCKTPCHPGYAILVLILPILTASSCF